MKFIFKYLESTNSIPLELTTSTNRSILLSFFILFFSTLLTAQNFNQVIKAVASDRSSLDGFGNSVSISGNYAIIGSQSEDHDVNGDIRITNAGSAYIFERNITGDWIQTQKLVSSDRGVSDQFGFSVAISGDYAVIGAPFEDQDVNGQNFFDDAGSAYIFERGADGIWVEVQKIVPSDREADDRFGYSVAISGDYMILGALLEEDDLDGNNSRTFAGSSYVFERGADGEWTEIQKLVASDRAFNDRFGHSVAIDGNFAIVGAFQEDHDANGTNSFNNSGAAYIFERNALGNWSEKQKIVASDRGERDVFGFSVSINGDYIVVGSRSDGENENGMNSLDEAGSAYVFKRDINDNWIEEQKLVASNRSDNAQFGFSVSLSGNTLVVGARLDEQCYVFKQDVSGIWREEQSLNASDSGADQFGFSVSVDGAYLIVGAPDADEDENGLNPASDAGAGYFFETNSNNLPVEWLSFSLSSENGMLGEENQNYFTKKIFIKWETTEDSENAGFNIERSVNGNNWLSIGEVFPRIGSVQEYDFIDESPQAGANYYRIRQSDYDGTITYSIVRYVFLSGRPLGITIFPNPTKDVMSFYLPGLEGDIGISLTDISGREVLLGNFKNNDNINISNLSAGVYLLSAMDNNGQLRTSKLLIR